MTANFTEDFSLNSAISHLMGLSGALWVSACLSSWSRGEREASCHVARCWRGLRPGAEQDHGVTFFISKKHFVHSRSLVFELEDSEGLSGPNPFYPPHPHHVLVMRTQGPSGGLTTPGAAPASEPSRCASSSCPSAWAPVTRPLFPPPPPASLTF